MVSKLKNGEFVDNIQLSHTSIAFIRGFRQATRGPDTGAFHHPLFRRDKPELCLEMVCQKSRERQPLRRGNTSEKGDVLPAMTSSDKQDRPSRSDSCNASCPSSDDRSVSSSASSAPSSLNYVDKTITNAAISIVSGIQSDFNGHLPFISNDLGFVASTLRERNRNEVLKAAKAMLYDAYLKAARADT